MAWDDDKSTATDPDNPSASEQLTADEWDNHVGDQLSRLEYGPLSSRPAASERDQGALWFDEYGRISRVDSNGNWVLDSFGTSSNPVPDTSHFNAISTGQIGNGPTVYVSQSNSLQDAIDEAGGGHLLIDDTVETDGVVLTESNNDGLTIEFLGDSWIYQSEAADLGGADVLEEAGSDHAVDLLLINPQVQNPYLDDADIYTEDSIPNSADRSGFIENWDGELTVIGGHIHHLNGYGLYGIGPHVRVYGTTVRWVTYDSFRSQSKTTVFDGVLSEDVGRHGMIVNDTEGGHAEMSGHIYRSHTCGLRSVGQNEDLMCHLDVTVEESTNGGGSHGANAALDRGVFAGSVTVKNPSTDTDANGEAVFNMTGKAAGLTAIVQSDVEVALDSNAVYINPTGEGNEMSVVVDNVGDSNNVAIYIITAFSDQYDIIARNVPYETLRFHRSQKCLVDVISENPGASGTDTSHVYVGGLSQERAVDNNIRLICDGNAPDHAIRSVNGNENWNRISGNVRNAFANSATSGLGADNDLSDLIS